MQRSSPVSCAIVLFLTATAACAVDGQVPQQVTAAEFFAAEVNGHTDLRDFQTHADHREPLKVTMGQPTRETCDTTWVATTCAIEWDGISVFYTNQGGDVGQDLGLSTLTLTNPSAFLDYGGTTIRVGDPISRLQQIFPEAYRDRGNNCPPPPGYPPCRHAALVHIHDDGVNSMSFTYDPSTLSIEKIMWFRNII